MRFYTLPSNPWNIGLFHFIPFHYISPKFMSMNVKWNHFKITWYLCYFYITSLYCYLASGHAVYDVQEVAKSAILRFFRRDFFWCEPKKSPKNRTLFWRSKKSKKWVLKKGPFFRGTKGRFCTTQFKKVTPPKKGQNWGPQFFRNLGGSRAKKERRCLKINRVKNWPFWTRFLKNIGFWAKNRPDFHCF